MISMDYRARLGPSVSRKISAVLEKCRPAELGRATGPVKNDSPHPMVAHIASGDEFHDPPELDLDPVGRDQRGEDAAQVTVGDGHVSDQATVSVVETVHVASAQGAQGLSIFSNGLDRFFDPGSAGDVKLYDK